MKRDNKHSISMLRSKMLSSELSVSGYQQLNRESQEGAHPHEKEDHPHLMITDLALHFDDLDVYEQGKITHKNTRIIDMWILLILLAIVAAGVSVSFLYCVDKLTEAIYDNFYEHKTTGNFFLALLISLALANTAAGICYFFRDAEGSGIPELKSILAGISIYKYLAFKTLVAKIIGLGFSLSSGLFLGREGPFVHISASIAHNLSKFEVFKRIHHKNTFRKQILATAGGIGITSTFGTPIGGCLYSIETTSTFFAVGTFWKSFFCSFVCALFYHVYANAISLETWSTMEYNYNVYSQLNLEILAFFFLGLLCGLIGVAHIHFVTTLIHLRKKIKNQFLARFGYTSLCVIITISIVYYFWDFGFRAEKGVEILFTAADDDTKWELDKWKLLGLFFLKLLCNGLAVSCPLPAGIFVPMFLSGSIFGRVYGTFMKEWFGITEVSRYCVVGAASLTASVTHTLAIAVISFEVVGQDALLYPLLTGVVTSYLISKATSLSVYHILVEIKNLPFLPKLLEPSEYKKVAADIMNGEFPYLTTKSTFQEVALILSEIKSKIVAIPIVEDDSGKLVCSVQSANLRNYVKKAARKHKKELQNSKSGLQDGEISGLHLSTSAVPKKGFLNFMQRLESVPPMHQEEIPKDIVELQEIPVSDSFWQTVINLRDKVLNVDKSPFTVLNSARVLRLHYLFSMLGLHQVFVLEKGTLVGVIMKESFQPRN